MSLTGGRKRVSEARTMWKTTEPNDITKIRPRIHDIAGHHQPAKTPTTHSPYMMSHAAWVSLSVVRIEQAEFVNREHHEAQPGSSSDEPAPFMRLRLFLGSF